MTRCLFVSDLHGHPDRYEKLFRTVRRERPDGVFLGGDLLPGAVSALLSPGERRPEATLHGGAASKPDDEPGEPEIGGEPEKDFLSGFLIPALERLKRALEQAYPQIFVILGNDDGRAGEPAVLEAEAQGLWRYAHARRHAFGDHVVYGYACVPPTPFLLKDWERYDVSRHVDPGASSPEEGWLTVEVPVDELRYSTIQKDLAALYGAEDLARAISLFHAPPYDTCLDRAGLDGLCVDHIPLDVHVGSIAIRRFLEERGPRVSLHGHVHEAACLTGSWRERIGRTCAFSAAHDGPELALVRFCPEDPASATRELL